MTEFKTFYHNQLSSVALTASAVNKICFFFVFFLNFTDYVVKLNRHQLATLCFTKHKYFCSSFMK